MPPLKRVRSLQAFCLSHVSQTVWKYITINAKKWDLLDTDCHKEVIKLLEDLSLPNVANEKLGLFLWKLCKDRKKVTDVTEWPFYRNIVFLLSLTLTNEASVIVLSRFDMHLVVPYAKNITLIDVKHECTNSSCVFAPNTCQEFITQEILPSMKNLIILDLNGEYSMELKMMAALGTCCPKLRDIIALKISNAVIALECCKKLCYNEDKPNPCCNTLQVISVSEGFLLEVENTEELFYKAYLFLLNTLPNLKSLGSEVYSDVLLNYARQQNEDLLHMNFQMIVFKNGRDTNITEVFECFPNARKLFIELSNPDFLDHAPIILPNLQKLFLIVEEEWSSSVPRIYLNNLKEFVFCCEGNIDISEIAHFFPNLETLVLYFEDMLTCTKYKGLELSNIRHVKIGGVASDSTDFNWLPIISKSVKILSFDFSQSLTEMFTRDKFLLISFPELEELYISGRNSFNETDVRNIVKHCPNLQVFSFNSEPMEQLEKEFENENMSIKLHYRYLYYQSFSY